MKQSVLFVIALTIFSFTLILHNNAWSQQSYFMTSSRGTFDLNNGTKLQENVVSLPNANSLLNLETNECPPAISIYVHGIWATPAIANEQTERVFLSLKNLDYNNPVIGFSWDSNTSLSHNGWEIAKIIANNNGPLLANFIFDFKKKCPDSEVRIVAHSLGSRVILSSLQSIDDLEQFPSLATNNNETATSKIIKSVHLMGAAVDDEQLSIDPSDCISNIPALECSGIPIENQVEYFYNLYNNEDNMLAPIGFFESIYSQHEDDSALGSFGVENLFNVPINYNEYNVGNEILAEKDANGDGSCDLPFGSSCTISLQGDNHFGYMGFRDSNKVVYDEGVMDVILDDWSSEN